MRAFGGLDGFGDFCCGAARRSVVRWLWVRWFIEGGQYQLRVVGQRFLELEVAGSRVAVTVHASVAARVVKRAKRILDVLRC